MQSLKHTSIEVLKSLPDSCSLEEIMYKLDLTAKVLEGLKDEESNNTVSTEELLKRISEWKQK